MHLSGQLNHGHVFSLPEPHAGVGRKRTIELL